MGGAEDPFVRRDNGRSVEPGECASISATVMIEVKVSSGTIGVEGSSASASPSGAVCSAIMGEKVNGGCGALGVTGVVVSSTVSGISWLMSPAEDLREACLKDFDSVGVVSEEVSGAVDCRARREGTWGVFLFAWG